MGGIQPSEGEEEEGGCGDGDFDGDGGFGVRGEGLVMLVEKGDIGGIFWGEEEEVLEFLGSLEALFGLDEFLDFGGEGLDFIGGAWGELLEELECIFILLLELFAFVLKVLELVGQGAG